MLASMGGSNPLLPTATALPWKALASERYELLPVIDRWSSVFEGNFEVRSVAGDAAGQQISLRPLGGNDGEHSRRGLSVPRRVN